MLMLAAGGECVSDIEYLRAAGALFAVGASAPALYRTVRAVGAPTRDDLWAAVAGGGGGRGVAAGAAPVALDIDATLIEVHSENKQGTAAHYKGGFGFHPLLRPGNAAANSIDDHVELLDAAIGGLPAAVAAGHRCGDAAADVARPLRVRADSAGRSVHIAQVCGDRNVGFSLVARADAAIVAALADADRRQGAIRQNGDSRRGAAVTDLIDTDDRPTGRASSCAANRATAARNARCCPATPTATGATGPTKPAAPSPSTRTCAPTPTSKTTSKDSNPLDSPAWPSTTSPPTPPGSRSCAGRTTSSAGSNNSPAPAPSPAPRRNGSAGRCGTPPAASPARATPHHRLPANHPGAAHLKMTVVGGVDTHRDNHVAATIDSTGRLLDVASFPASGAGYSDLLDRMRSWGDLECVGIEGTGSYGAGLARRLAAGGVPVVEVIRPDRQARRRRAKSDPADAEAAARAVLSGEATVRPKSADGPVEPIRLLHATRRSAVKARTCTINQLKGHLVTIAEQVAAPLRGLSSSALVDTCARLRPNADSGEVVAAAKQALRVLARRYQALSGEISELDTEIARLCAKANPALPAARGVGPEVAATLLIAAGDNPERLTSEASFAALCGASPVEASSGRPVRHRLNRGGDRQANNALWRIAMVRLRRDERTIAYAARRSAQGKSRREILRCLKRYIAREIHQLLTDPPAVPAGAHLRQRRHNAGITLQHAAAAINTQPSHISALSHPPVETAYECLGDEPARTLTENLPPTTWDQFATKSDLATVEERLNSRIRVGLAEVRGEISELRGETKLGLARQTWIILVALVAGLAPIYIALFAGVAG